METTTTTDKISRKLEVLLSGAAVDTSPEVSAFGLDGIIVVRVTGFDECPDFAVVANGDDSSVVYLDDMYFTKPLKGLKNEHLRNLARKEVLERLGDPMDVKEAVARLIEPSGFSVEANEEDGVDSLHFALMGGMEWQLVLMMSAGLKPVTTPQMMAKMLSRGVAGFRLPNGAAAVGGDQDGRVLGLKAILVEALRAGGLKIVPAKKAKRISR